MPDLPDERGRGGGGGERAGGQRGKDARNMGERPAPGPYTVVNLKQVEDQAPKHGLSPGLESRFARVALELHASGLSYFRIAPDFRQPFGHRHQEQEEIYLVIGGSARAKVGDETVELGTWDALRVSPTEMRCIEGGPEGAEIVAFGSPSHDNRDVEAVQEWWTD